jgi:nicotinamide riboside kinase
MKPILIQFTGAQSTGKTTLVKELQKLYGGKASFIGEASRTLKAKKGIAEVDVQANSDIQIILNSELMLQYIEKLDSHPKSIIIAERTPICCLAYGRYVKTTDSHMYMLEQTERLIVAQQLRSDIKTLTFYCPLLDSFEEDGFRYKESQEMIDHMIKSILNEFNIVHYILPLTSVKHRIKFVQKIIEENFSWVILQVKKL